MTVMPLDENKNTVKPNMANITIPDLASSPPRPAPRPSLSCSSTELACLTGIEKYNGTLTTTSGQGSVDSTDVTSNSTQSTTLATSSETMTLVSPAESAYENPLPSTPPLPPKGRPSLTTNIFPYCTKADEVCTCITVLL